MVNMCCACGAKAMTSGVDKVSFHRFPSLEKKQELHQMWVLNMQTIRKNFFPSKTSVLCSRHFLASDFKIGENVHRITLKGNAIPTVFDGITPLTNSKSQIDTAQMYDNYIQELAEKKRLKQEQVYGIGITGEDEILQEVVETIPIEEGHQLYEEVIDSKNGIKKIFMTTTTTPQTDDGTGGGVQVIGNIKTDEEGRVIISESPPVFAITVPHPPAHRQVQSLAPSSSSASIQVPTMIKGIKSNNSNILTSDLAKKKMSKKTTIKTMKMLERKVMKLQEELRKSHSENQRLKEELSSFKSNTTQNNNILMEINSRGLTNTVKSEKGHRKPLNKPFSNELEAFAVTLYNKSPKAYRFTRKALNSALPSVSYIKKYRRKSRLAAEGQKEVTIHMDNDSEDEEDHDMEQHHHYEHQELMQDVTTHEIVVGRIVETTETEKAIDSLEESTQYVEYVNVTTQP